MLMCRTIRGNGCRGIVLDMLLVLGLVGMCILFLKRSSLQQYTKSFSSDKKSHSHDHDGEENASNEEKFHPADDAQASRDKGSSGQANLIEARIKELADVRDKECLSQSYDVKESVSIIIDFNDYQFYNLKSTVSSIVNVETDHIAEIIIVDDGSTLKYIVDECSEYVKTLPKARLVRHETQLGQLKSRLAALSLAKYDIVVFVDVNVVCSRGWLVPLIDLLVKHPRAIAVPHHDLIHDAVTLEYRPTPKNLVASWTWNLAIRMRVVVDPRIQTNTQYVISPVVRGNAFAVRKAFLESVGSLEEFFEDGGGEYVDLSLKTWLCDGTILAATCSRVGVLNLFNPLRIRARKNVRYIIEKYFGSQTDAALRLNGITGHQSTLKHSSSMPDLEKCKDMDWYLKVIKNETFLPTKSVVHFGVLRVHSGRCARVSDADAKIDLYPCDNDPNEAPMEFESSGKIRTADGKCLATYGSAYMFAETCQRNETRQTWHYTDKFELVNVWSGYCARHVTDPDKNNTESRQIAMAQMCDAESMKNTGQFQKWSFIPV